jgi:hypothetical protein
VKLQPLWVQAKETQALLNRLMDRLDAAEVRGSSKAQSVLLGEKLWPELFNAPFESRKEDLWGQLVEMCRWGWLQAKPESALRSRSGYAQAVRLMVADEPAVRVATGRPERLKTSTERWRDAVSQGLDAPDEVKAAVSDYCIDMSDHSMEEVVVRLNRMEGLKGRPLLLREVSAQLFWGMSKVLDKRQGLVAALLGLDECPFPETPVQLQVHIPEGWQDGVLFIENLMSFERAVRSEGEAFRGLTLIYASGFKGSAQRLRTASGCSLYYSRGGVRVGPDIDRFEAWLFGKSEDAPMPTFFWGDLDFSGMRILAAMRSSFPELRAWEKGYSPMLRALLEGQGHSPEAADKKGQCPISTTGCGYADNTLLPALHRLGKYIDQEIFSV